MSDHEESLRIGYANGFVALESSIEALREHIKVVKKEPNKVDMNEIDTVFKRIESKEKECKENSDNYIQYLEANKR